MKVLITLCSLDAGGAEKVMHEYVLRMLPAVSFDFVVMTSKEGILEKEMKMNGCNIFRVCPVRKNPLKHFFQMKKIINDGAYDIVHANGGYYSFFDVYAAKKCGVKTRIAHSHEAFVPEKIVKKIERKFFAFLTKIVATDLYACGSDAAAWMWGRCLKKEKIHIMRNGIDLKKFVFSSKFREEYRSQLNLCDKYVVGCVARFAFQKNHERLIEIFKEISLKNENAVLLLVGNGELEDNIRKKVCLLGIKNKVVFLGTRNDVNKLLSAMDVFLLPSRYEGIGIVFVEAQANGLPVVTSSEITHEADCGFMKFVSLKDDNRKWVDAVELAKRQFGDVSKIIADCGYDINFAAQREKQRYKELCNKH